jgi:putative intracellular protease/amidase
MPQIELAGRIIQTDEGYLVAPGDWTEEVAEELARRERAQAAVRAVSLRLREAGLQVRRHAPAAGLEYGIGLAVILEFGIAKPTAPASRQNMCDRM